MTPRRTLWVTEGEDPPQLRTTEADPGPGTNNLDGTEYTLRPTLLPTVETATRSNTE